MFNIYREIFPSLFKHSKQAKMELQFDPKEVVFIKYTPEKPLWCEIEPPKRNIFVKRPLKICPNIFEEYTLKELQNHDNLRFRYGCEIPDHILSYGGLPDQPFPICLDTIEKNFLSNFKSACEKFQLIRKSRVAVHFKNGEFTEHRFKRNPYALHFINQIKEKAPQLVEVKKADV